MIRDHTPVLAQAFQGLFVRDGIDSTPNTHWSDCLNVQVTEGGVDTRDGFSKIVTLSGIVRHYVYKIYGQADRFLMLDNTGKLWDSTNLGAPILNIAGMKDFVFVNISGRAYISPTDGTTGLAGDFIYVYTGSGLARKAAGAAPTGGAFTAANSASSGHVEAGFHLFMVAYQTDTGFITAPGPAVFASITAPGGLSVDLSGIPIGPAHTAARIILATKVIQNYNGNQNGYTPYFVPGGVINDNVSTTITVSFFDADLLVGGDATYLFDLFASLPATLFLSTYHGRLVGGGENANPSVVRVAEAGQPEAINQVTGLLLVDPANTGDPISNAQEQRDVLYLFKPTRTYSTADNNGDPSTWQVVTLDEGAGTHNHGIGTILDTGGVNIDKLFVVDHSGLLLFNGAYLGPQELSWKVRDIWGRINKQYFSKINIAVDPVAKLIFIAVPLDAATEPSHILVGDFKNIVQAWYADIRWMLWQPFNKPTSLTVHNDVFNTYIPNVLDFSSSDGNLYQQTAGQHNDYGNAIPTPFFTTGLLPDDADGSLVHCAGTQLRVIGSGSLVLTYSNQDSTQSATGQSLTLSTSPGFEPYSLVNFNAMKYTIKFSVSSFNNWFRINRIRTYVKEIFKQVPNVY